MSRTRRAEKNWATAYQTEQRQPHGVQGGGRWTAGGINPAARQQAAIARHEALVHGGGTGAGASPAKPAAKPSAKPAARPAADNSGGDAEDQNERAQASGFLQQAAQLQSQINQLKADLKAVSAQYSAATSRAPGATTASGNTNAQAAAAAARPGAAAGSSTSSRARTISSLQAQQAQLQSRISNLTAQRAQLLQRAQQLLRDAQKGARSTSNGDRVPDATKAATLDGQDLVYASFPIEKWEDGPDGSVLVYGRASTPEVDTDEQIVDGEWSAKALQAWMDTGPNLRVQHNPQRDPALPGLKVEVNRDGDGAHWVKSIVDEPGAVRLVKKGHLRAYSVGIARPTIIRDVTGKARGGIIKGGELAELSLVDRQANRSCSLQIVKAAKDGTADFTGKVFGAAGLLEDEEAGAEPEVTKDRKDGVTVTLPRNMSLSIKPSDLAKLATFKQGLVTNGNGAAKAAAPGVTKAGDQAFTRDALQQTISATATMDEPDDVLKAVMATEGAIYKRDIDTETRRRLAGEGKALPNLSYPIESAEDLGNAATLARSGHGDVKGAKKLISRRAKELGVPNPLKDKKPALAGKAAEPDVTKCGCDGGMNGKVPCTECPAGARMAKRMAKKARVKAKASAAKARKAVRTALTPVTEKKKGKLRALCPGCGAKQNKEHMHCTECGVKLPAMPPMVAKNHDFQCLGCRTDLDKGEKHCPQCGKENPGYNMMADQKIPANEAVKAAGKGRVAGGKKGKKGKGKPFGGQQATPFGKDSDDEKDAKGGDASAEKGMKPGKGKKGKTGAKPTPGEAGGVPGQKEKPVPRHREPDGATSEAFEADAHLEDGDDEKPTKIEARTLKSGDPEMRAAIALKALGVPPHLGALHAITCPAYDPQAVAKAFPYPVLSTLDTGEWQAKGLEASASAPLEVAKAAMDLWQHAVVLKNADPETLTSLREEAHKAFRDANPGPGTFPEPGEIGPARFHRPYISEGHGAPSPAHDGPHHAQLPPVGGIVSEDYTRGYISEGHAEESPANGPRGNGPMPAPDRTGVPTSGPGRSYYTNTARESARHALEVMHSHIAHQFPDLCSMRGAQELADHPVPVPHGVPSVSPAPGTKKAARVAAKKAQVKAKRAKVKAARVLKARRRKLESRVLKGALTVEQAREKLGLKPFADTPFAPILPVPVDAPQSPGAQKAAPPVAAALDPEALKAAIAEANAPLLAQLAEARKTAKIQGKAFKRLQKTTDAIASQPDTSQSPMRGVALTKQASPTLAAPVTVAQSAEQAQVMKMRTLQEEWRMSPDPGRREAAYRELTQLLGIASMSPNPDPTPMRT